MITRFWPPILIIAAFLGLAVTYSVVTPIFEAPDELWHYPLVWQLARTAQLPVQNPASPQLWQQEGSQPPLYYALAALLTAAVPADDLPQLIRRNPHADLGLVSLDGNANIIIHTPAEQWPWRGAVLAIHLARLFSVGLGAGTVLAVYALSRRLWPANPLFAPVAMAFVAFNPMFIFISGAVNNDNLIILLATLAVWQLAVLLTDSGSFPWRRVILLGVLAGLAALAKVSGLGLLALIGLTLLGWGYRQRRWTTALLATALVGGLALALAGWWYWRNFTLYGDWTGAEIMVQMMGARPTPPTCPQLLAETPGLARSFWGLFGYFSVALPGWVYGLFNLIFAAGGAGWLLIWAKKEHLPPGLRPTWPMLLGWLVILLAGLVQWTLRTPATQGRLLFPALAAIAPLWAAGWLALAPRRLAFLPGLALLAVSVWVPGGVIAPAYAPPPPIDGLPAAAQPLAVTFGDTATLLGFAPGATAVPPGGILPVTFYWRAERPTAVNYSVFLHLVDDNGLIVAQRDVLHGPGVYPTGQWLPGAQFADTYALRLPSTAFAPAQARLELGLYNSATGQRLPVSSGGDSITFGQIKIDPRPGDRPNPQQLQFADGVTLAGYAINRRQAAPGDTIELTLYWQAEGRPAQNYKVFVHLVNDAGARAAHHDSEPQAGAAPTGRWQPGQQIIDSHPLAIAPNAPPGAYRLVVGLYNGATGQRLPLQKDGSAWVQTDAVTLAGVRVVAP